MAVQNTCNDGAGRGLGAWGLTLGKDIVLVHAFARIKHPNTLQNLGGTRDAYIHVVGSDHVAGHPLHIVDRHHPKAFGVGRKVIFWQVVQSNVQGLLCKVFGIPHAGNVFFCQLCLHLLQDDRIGRIFEGFEVGDHGGNGVGCFFLVRLCRHFKARRDRV